MSRPDVKSDPSAGAADTPFSLSFGVSPTGEVNLSLAPTLNYVDPPISAADLALHMSLFRNEPPHQLAALLRTGRYNVNGVDYHGNTPLHLCATLNRSVEHARLLLAYGAHNQIRNTAGWTPIQEAVSIGNRAMIRLLWQHLKLKAKWDLRERAPLILVCTLPLRCPLDHRLLH
jgi:ankyrin repeat protein